MAHVGPSTMADKYRIMIYGPKDDGTYVVEFRAEGEMLAISIAITDTAVIRRFQDRMPYGLLVPPRRRTKVIPQSKK
jgi:hypothetical protein